jgi:hypothetical protein
VDIGRLSNFRNMLALRNKNVDGRCKVIEGWTVTLGPALRRISAT